MSASSLTHRAFEAGVRVRRVARSDFPTWLRMRQALWPEGGETEHAEEIEAFFDSGAGDGFPLAEVLVASDADGRPLGFLELSVRAYAEGCGGRVPYIEGWYVEPEARGRGVGGALVEAAEAWARERGYAEIASDTELENEASQAAHRALGYEEVERTVHYRKAL